MVPVSGTDNRAQGTRFGDRIGTTYESDRPLGASLLNTRLLDLDRKTVITSGSRQQPILENPLGVLCWQLQLKV
uniref:(California timema) hypothetical protein n=1 Tax=Timema californicum TaxID=61474 RepID=A0A7R9JA78_TIMCA|nr:unnamed protein product [Timema californicum]